MIMFVEAGNNFVRNAEARYNKSILTVAVSGLIQVHEIHVDLVIRKFLICLCMQMKERLCQDLKASDPHLGRGECVHPCDHTDAVVIIFSSADILYTELSGLDSGHQDDFHYVAELLIEEVHHLATISSYLRKALCSVKILAAGNKIQFFHNDRLS